MLRLFTVTMELKLFSDFSIFMLCDASTIQGFDILIWLYDILKAVLFYYNLDYSSPVLPKYN